MPFWPTRARYLPAASPAPGGPYVRDLGYVYFKKDACNSWGLGGIWGSTGNEFVSAFLRPPGRGRGEKWGKATPRRPKGDPDSRPPGSQRELKVGEETALGVSLLPHQPCCWQPPPLGTEPESASGRKGGGEEGALCETSPRGWGFEVPRPDTHPPSPSQKQQAARPGTGVWGATSWSWPGAAGRGHRRCRQRTPGSAGRAPTHPSRCCTPARCLSRC